MKCPSCQNQIDQDSKFCEHCGFDLTQPKPDANGVSQKLAELTDRVDKVENYLSLLSSHLTSFSAFDPNRMDNGKDELFDEAVKVVKEYEKASASLLQRKLGIGY